ncbi:MAG: TonB-dependent receptor, partial [Ignavibacteria bacterium]|nr:TonB-dependent receptor [Ignavibacteria bacterium]
MNWSKSFNLQANLIYRIAAPLKIKYEIVLDNGKSQSYDRSFKYNPDGRVTDYSKGMIHSFDITHTVSDRMFYTLKASFGTNEAKSYLYEDPLDPRQLPSLYARNLGNTTFLTGGTDNSHFYRKTQTIGVKGDLVAQLFRVHEVKFGFEIRRHKLNLESFTTQIGKLDAQGNFTSLTNDDLLYDSALTIIRRIPTDTSLYTNYEKTPTQFAAYLLDKIELASSMILNVGLRYEYFDPASQYNPNLSTDWTELQRGAIIRSNQTVKPKHRLSPRFSVSYPITDQGVIRFSYGHFYQVPSLASLYSNPNFYVANVGENPTFGNPNVEPQKSVQYELGLQQLLAEDLSLNLTGYYKDVSNYIYT